MNVDYGIVPILAAAIGLAQVLANVLGRLVDRISPGKNGVFSDKDREFVRELFYRLHKEFESTRAIAKTTESLGEKRNDHLANLVRLVDAIERRGGSSGARR